MASLTVENYVKVIYQISSTNDEKPAATGQIAEALTVSPGTVTSMLRTLDESSLATYTPYEGVYLTEAGRRLALRVLRRHRLIELFLVNTLKLTWDEVHDEAEDLEHAVSDLLVDRIDEFLGHPESDPHGDPIPTAEGKVPTSHGTTLDLWDLNRSFRLVRVVDQSPEFLRFLSGAGLTLGTTGSVVASMPEGNVLTLELAGSRMPLGLDAARKLLVRSVET